MKNYQWYDSPVSSTCKCQISIIDVWFWSYYLWLQLFVVLKSFNFWKVKRLDLPPLNMLMLSLKIMLAHAVWVLAKQNSKVQIAAVLLSTQLLFQIRYTPVCCQSNVLLRYQRENNFGRIYIGNKTQSDRNALQHNMNCLCVTADCREILTIQIIWSKIKHSEFKIIWSDLANFGDRRLLALV